MQDATTVFPHMVAHSEVTVADFIRHFAHWRKFSEKNPVAITNHGQATHVMLGIEAFSACVGAERADASCPDTPSRSPEAIAELVNWLPIGLLLCDDGLAIRQISQVLATMTGVSPEAAKGKPLWATFPLLAGTLFQTYIQRTLASGVPCSADLPSPLREGHWVHLSVIPLHRGLCIVLRDITEEVTHSRMADVKEAIFQAMTAHGGIGYMRLSARGTIERIDEPLCRMVGLPAKRLLHAQAVDLVPVQARVAFRERLEHVLTGHGGAHFDTQLMSNSGAIITAHCAMSELRGAYGNEGCVVLLTPLAAQT